MESDNFPNRHGERPSIAQERSNVEVDELSKSKIWETIQFDVVKTLANTDTWHGALSGILRAVAGSIAAGRGRCWGAFWSNEKDRRLLNCISQIQVPAGAITEFEELSKSFEFARGCGLPGRAWSTMKAVCVYDLDNDLLLPRATAARDCGLTNGIAFPVRDKDKFLGVFEFFAEKEEAWNIAVMESLGRQIGQFISRKEAEDSRERLANIVEYSSDAIVLMSADSKIIGWNHGAEVTFGYRPAQIIGKDFSVLIPRDKDAELARLLRATLNSHERVEGYETNLRSMSGKSIDVLVFTIPWFTDAGKYNGCSLTMHNITERKENERRVGEFYSMVSHELRTPLTSIRGALGLIESGIVEAGTEECVELITAARTSADRLIRLINDMLDLKKIEAGKMELRKSRVDVAELISCSIVALQGLSEEFDVDIDSTVDNIDDVSVYADWDKATQVITNLVSNAMKFSPKGGTVILRAMPGEDDTVRFSIIDSGPGIAKEDLGKLFQNFQQLDSSDSRPVGGTGLGLAITKALVEQHGGRIGVESVLGEGSEFWFELPKFKAEKRRRQTKMKLLPNNPQIDRGLASSNSQAWTAKLRKCQ